MKLKFNIFIVLLVVLAILSRLLPHPLNFTPITGIALLSGCYIQSKYMKFLLPFAILFASDILLNYFLYSSTNTLFSINYAVYLSFFLIVIGGSYLQNKVRTQHVFVASLLSSILFFVLTNLGSWWVIPEYSKDLSGIISAFVAGIPFFGNTITGDLVYSFLLFGCMEYYLQKNRKFAIAK